LLFKSNTKGIDRLLIGDVDTGKAILSNYINATIGFEISQIRKDIPIGTLKSIERQAGIKFK